MTERSVPRDTMAMPHEIHSPLIFWTAAGLLVAYILSMMVRRRRSERPGAADREPEL